MEYLVAVVEGHNNATVKAFYDYLKGPQAAEIFKRYGFNNQVMILTDPEWQAVLLSLKVSSLAVLFSLPFGIFFAWLLGTLHVSGQSSARQRTGFTAGVTARGRRLLIISFDGTARIYR